MQLVKISDENFKKIQSISETQEMKFFEVLDKVLTNALKEE